MLEKLHTIASARGQLKRWMNLKSLYDLDERFRIMDRFELFSGAHASMPPVEELGDALQAADMAKLMNDELAELIGRYPDRFPAFVGALSFLDADLAIREVDRALQARRQGDSRSARMSAAGHSTIRRCLPIFDAIADSRRCDLAPSGSGTGSGLSDAGEVKVRNLVVLRLAL